MAMPERKNSNRPAGKSDDGMLKGSGMALAELHKALKALAFYPVSHPLREEILLRAYQSIKGLMIESGLSLVVHRSGLSFADREEKIESSRMILSLAKELFTREIQRLSFLPDLTYSDFMAFITLLAQEPQRLIAEGGVARFLSLSGITTIVANEINISAVFTKRASGGPAEAFFPGEGLAGSDGEAGGSSNRNTGTAVDAAWGESGRVVEQQPLDRLDDLTAQELFSLMEKEFDDSRYVRMANLLEGKGCSLKEDGGFDLLFLMLLGLLNQNADATRSEQQRDVSLRTFHYLAGGTMLEHLLDHLEDESFKQKEIVYLVLHHQGKETVDAVIPRLVASDCQFARKALTTALLRLGSPAVPALLALLTDGNWQVVRAAASVLGEMRNRDAVKGLALTAYHADTRVRLEAIRALAEIGGREATMLLLDLFRDQNKAIRRQVILWLGVTRNESALQPLLDLVLERDFAGKNLTLKKEALLAIGRIKDSRSLGTLIRLVEKRHVLFPGRWEELKLLALETIGRLDGKESQDFLRKIASRGGRIGRASAAVLQNLGEGTRGEND
ncbi:MAG: HEAT repeat domain-containing protein [Deltaproteobacteria bacterium]|nr:HEAT repeat domain-containing protein [Deltaproteobacteria bacterium]TLN02775.1 MAG: HEAT repeat domain-containing protein [bacterium]